MISHGITFARLSSLSNGTRSFPQGPGACSFAAGVRKVACRDVSRSLTGSWPEDFPGGGNHSGVCCYRDLTWARQSYSELVGLITDGENR